MNRVGVLHCPRLAQLLSERGLEVVSGQDFRSSAQAARAAAETGPIAVVVVPPEGMAASARAWKASMASRAELVEVDEPIALADLVSRLGGKCEPGDEDLVVAPDGSVSTAAQPVQTPVATPASPPWAAQPAANEAPASPATPSAGTPVAPPWAAQPTPKAPASPTPPAGTPVTPPWAAQSASETPATPAAPPAVTSAPPWATQPAGPQTPAWIQREAAEPDWVDRMSQPAPQSTAPTHPSSPVLVVVSATGGVGRTMTALALGCEASRRGLRAPVVVEAGPPALAATLRLAGVPTLGDAAGGARTSQVVLPPTKSHPTHLVLAPADGQTQVGTPTITAVVASLASHSDLVVIDAPPARYCPPGLLEALVGAGATFLVLTDPSRACLEATRALVSRLASPLAAMVRVPAKGMPGPGELDRALPGARVLGAWVADDAATRAWAAGRLSPTPTSLARAALEATGVGR